MPIAWGRVMIASHSGFARDASTELRCTPFVGPRACTAGGPIATDVCCDQCLMSRRGTPAEVRPKRLVIPSQWSENRLLPTWHAHALASATSLGRPCSIIRGLRRQGGKGKRGRVGKNTRKSRVTGQVCNPPPPPCARHPSSTCHPSPKSPSQYDHSGAVLLDCTSGATLVKLLLEELDCWCRFPAC